MDNDTATIIPFRPVDLDNPGPVTDHLAHDEPVAGCAWCWVRPLLADLHRVWQGGNVEAVAVIWSRQDGYGHPGATPVQGLDWSGARDSTPATIRNIHATLTQMGFLP